MLKVLIVDDDLSLRILLAHMLSKLGHTSREAQNGVQGEQIALEWQPDVTLMDLMMPLQDGYITCVNLRQKGFAGNIVIMSSSPIAQGNSEAQLYGADAFLQKPTLLRGLQKYLDSFLLQHTATS